MNNVSVAFSRLVCVLLYSIAFVLGLIAFAMGLVIPALALEFIWRVVL